MFTIGHALANLRPQGDWQIIGDDLYENLNWRGGGEKPTEAEINAEIARLQTEYETKEYQRQRAAEYPSIGDQLDALFHAGLFPEDMAAKLQAVKDKYPKV